MNPHITLHWAGVRELCLLHGDGTLFPNGGQIDSRAVPSWPLRFRVGPLAPTTEFVVRLFGEADNVTGEKAVDIVHGRVVDVDLDVDANHDGKIDDADEPLEVDPGGLACVCTNKLTPIMLTLQPAGLTGRLTLSATMGGDRIRIWKDAGRMIEVVLTNGCAQVAPGTLYVEGVTNSAALRDVELRLEYDENPPNQNNPLFKCEDRVKLTAVKIDFVTPAGDPVNAAVQSGDGQNEFTYSTATPGVLTMNLKAHVTPSGIANQIKGLCLFTVDMIAGSTLAWGSSNPNGKPTANGDDLLATVTFTGLPANNSDFGAKKAAIHFNASKQDEANYEVFFPRDVANNPGGSDPNWFYYWGQVYVNANVQYVAAAAAGRVPAMTGWTYNSVPSKTRIEIGSGHPAKYKSYGIGEEASGIDRYIMTGIHEEKHVAQIAAADALLPTSGADSFRFGWSWNQSTHNHWTKGPDGQWGVAGVDDDGNGVVDDAAVAPPFEPGNGDDISLDRATWPWWPNTWTLPGGVYATIHPIEGEAVKAADDAMNENDYAPQDWGKPGKNHKTVNKWDD
ncbi:MAG: hypothetical protein ACOX5G_01370 [Kiritimatiellia bacterium]